jgi:hypothetical protein
MVRLTFNRRPQPPAQFWSVHTWRAWVHPMAPAGEEAAPNWARPKCVASPQVKEILFWERLMLKELGFPQVGSLLRLSVTHNDGGVSSCGKSRTAAAKHYRISQDHSPTVH